jgi:polar amino acid transport system substrate-binding protein
MFSGDNIKQLLHLRLYEALILLLCAFSSSVAIAQDCKAPLVSGPPVWPPFINPEIDGMARDGIAIDFVDRIFDKLGVTYNLDQAKPWARVLKELEAGELDFAMAIFDVPERREKFAYTETWVSDDYAIITYKGRDFKYDSVEDLRGKSGAFYHGIRFPPPLDQAVADNDRLVTVTDAQQLHKMLKLERVDFVIASIPTFIQLLPEGYSSSEFTVLGASTVRIPIYMAFSKKSPCVALLEDVNKQIRNHREELADTIYEGVVTN